MRSSVTKRFLGRLEAYPTYLILRISPGLGVNQTGVFQVWGQ